MLNHATGAALCRTLAIPRISLSSSRILCNRPSQHHHLSSSRTVSSQASEMASEPLIPGSTLCGESGRIYTIREVLAERRKPLLCVYRARYNLNPTIRHSVLTITSAEGQNFVVKNMIPGEYKYQQDLQKPLSSFPNLRTVIDGVPGPELFIYPFLQTDLLQFAQKNLTGTTRKSMLKSALTGLAAMHDRNIIHTGKSYLIPLSIY